MTNNYGLVAANGTPKAALSQVARWNDRTKRHTLYTICGTQQDGWGLFNDPGTQAARDGLLALLRWVTGNNSLTLPSAGSLMPVWAGSPDAAIGPRVNSSLYNWVPVSYPAVAPGMAASLENNWQPQNISISDSAKMGAAELIRLIKATPGTFAIVGMSQGSVVASQVLKALLPGGSLASRYNDCIAGVAFGNPCRAPGGTFPGGVAADGAGVIALPNPTDPASGGLANVKTPAHWWEMSITGDFFSSAPTNTIAGPILAPLIQLLFHFPGSLGLSLDLLTSLLTALVASPLAVISVLLSAFVQGGFLLASQAQALLGAKEFNAAASALLNQANSTLTGILGTWVYQQIGAIDIPAVLREIEKSGYQGWITVELYPYIENPDEAGREAKRFVEEVWTTTN